MSDEYAVLACANFTWRHCTLFTLPSESLSRQLIVLCSYKRFHLLGWSYIVICSRPALTTSMNSFLSTLMIFTFGYQLSLAGEKIMYSPELLFYHDVSIQGKLIAPEWKVYYLCRNLILSKKIFQKNGVYSNSAIAIRILKYILILPWQRQKIFLYEIYSSWNFTWHKKVLVVSISLSGHSNEKIVLFHKFGLVLRFTLDRSCHRLP